ncbi:MAG: hypothetical protein HY848_00505 [Betaproteobacteria bacterium]|nr:hypothetical protein [Betaproteobacteria bacterium]
MKAILSILVALGIPAAFWNYYLRESPDIQYSLSAAIPLAFQELPKNYNERQGIGEFVQQIEIANSGRGEAKKIVVKIPKTISQYHLTKHSTSEQVDIYKTPGAFELSYPSLPPSSGFQITLMTSGEPLTERQLEVFHQGGKAKIVSPGSRSGESTLWNLMWILLSLFFYGWISYASFRDEFKYRFLFRRYSSNVEELLRNVRPWYIRQNDWPEVIEDLLRRALAEPVSPYSAISDCTPYKLLNSDKPGAISQSAWEKLKETSTDRLLALTKLHAERLATDAEISDLLNMQWPIGLSEASKAALMHSISKAYFDKIIASSSADDLVKILVEGKKHPRVSTDAWDRFKDRAAKEIAKDLAMKLIREDNFSAVANSPAWDVITYYDKDKLSQLRKGRMAAIAADEKLRESESLKVRLANLESSLGSREVAIAASEKQISTSRAKVNRQLDAIERVIADPAYLDRIEPDDDTFVAGNWVLLRRLVAKHR